MITTLFQILGEKLEVQNKAIDSQEQRGELSLDLHATSAQRYQQKHPQTASPHLLMHHPFSTSYSFRSIEHEQGHNFSEISHVR